MSLEDAVRAKRYHHQWTPDEIEVEPGGFSEDVKSDLIARGHSISERGIGCKMQAIATDGAERIGVSDERGEGFAIGGGQPPDEPEFAPTEVPRELAPD